MWNGISIASLIFFSQFSFSQDFPESPTGEQGRSCEVMYTLVDTKINFVFESGNRAFVFKHIDSLTEVIFFGNQTLDISKYLNPERHDAFDYFILLNTGINNIDFATIGGEMISIRQALSKIGDWSPIEIGLFPKCGNSYYPKFSLSNGQFIIIKTWKQRGNFKTKECLRLRTSSGVILCEPYWGYIDPNEFALNEKTWNTMQYAESPRLCYLK